MGKGYKIAPLALVALWLLAACGTNAWKQDPDVQAAKAACQGLDAMDEFNCIERHAVETLNPDVCRLAGIAIDDMCLQAVYEAADDPAICERIYLQGVQPNCQAYYAARGAVPTEAAMPLPSATWQRILFAYNHQGAAELWTVDPSSGAAQREIRPEQAIRDPALSPSGETLAYVWVTGDYGGVVSELWLMDRDGGHPRPLYVPPADQSVLSRPTWSPLGRELYFLQHGAGTDSQLLRIPVDGGEPATVLADCLDFSLSPDGQWLVGMDRERKLAVYDRDGSPIRDLEPQGVVILDAYSLALSPDGRLLAFQGTEAGGEDTWNLYVMDAEGRGVRRLTDLSGFYPSTASTGQVNGLAWTADGTHLIYSVDGQPKQRGIWRVGVDGGKAQRIFDWKDGEWAAIRGPWFEAP